MAAVNRWRVGEVLVVGKGRGGGGVVGFNKGYNIFISVFLLLLFVWCSWKWISYTPNIQKKQSWCWEWMCKIRSLLLLVKSNLVFNWNTFAEVSQLHESEFFFFIGFIILFSYSHFHFIYSFIRWFSLFLGRRDFKNWIFFSNIVAKTSLELN